jgi:hypothetical protein
MSKELELKKQLDEIKVITCKGPGMTGDCKYSGPTDTFLPNLSGYHNACRCPKCGSTRNDYNRLHATIVTLQFREAEERLERTGGEEPEEENQVKEPEKEATEDYEEDQEED